MSLTVFGTRNLKNCLWRDSLSPMTMLGSSWAETHLVRTICVTISQICDWWIHQYNDNNVTPWHWNVIMDNIPTWNHLCFLISRTPSFWYPILSTGFSLQNLFINVTAVLKTIIWWTWILDKCTFYIPAHMSRDINLIKASENDIVNLHRIRCCKRRPEQISF